MSARTTARRIVGKHLYHNECFWCAVMLSSQFRLEYSFHRVGKGLTVQNCGYNEQTKTAKGILPAAFQ